MLSKRVEQIIDSLRSGDVVLVDWLDASEGTMGVRPQDRHFDIPISTWGMFLGVKGKRAKYVVVVKEVIARKDIHYNSIPIGMIENVTVIARNGAPRLPKRQIRRVMKKVRRGHVYRPVSEVAGLEEMDL